MKKLLSLALTLALSFSLTVPAFAANKAGDTTITDANGTYTLSKPILYTISRSELEKINMDSVSVFINGEPINEDYFGSAQSYLRDYFFAKADYDLCRSRRHEHRVAGWYSDIGLYFD
ncbi:MAG: hypothetical protein ACLRNQ_27620 [Flavonifractor plautii]